ncbi:MAG TPA: acetyl-CoA carboxylase biotin carboxyl carrier protein [Chitinophagaceae bacterium]|jgi:acetyl-CoA carboxylase biotin carboxyl carrier protein|nr:acetyl-CoA carboxylase biotin carboxyl carrier protein [Chitinophagaceae bacterium]
MDFKQIQELINLVNESNIGEVSIEQKDFKITIKQKEEHVTQLVSGMQQAPMQSYQQLPMQQGLPSSNAANGQAETAALPSTTITIKSPMIGTFYKRPSPDKPNFLEIGDEVSPGKVVCIIEAMKLFNEIESEVSGKIVKILVDDASPVEYDQPLFLVEPS